MNIAWPLLFSLLLCGCSYSRKLATVHHVDGSGTTSYRAIHAGGILRPGVIVVVSQTLGSNPPVVLVQASGPPAAPSLTGAAGMVATAAAFGAALGRDEGGNQTTVIMDEPRAPMIDPPKPPKPPNPVVHPPNGRPPASRPPKHRPPSNARH